MRRALRNKTGSAMLIVIGSVASAFWGFDCRHPESDVDIVSLDNEETKRFLEDRAIVKSYTQHPKWKGKFHGALTTGKRFELETGEWESNRILDWETHSLVAPCKELGGIDVMFPGMDVLYAIKRSHAHCPQNWVKTMLWLEQTAKRYPIDTNILRSSFFKARKDEASSRKHTTGKVKLNVPNEKFFMHSQHLRKYDHDSIHEAIAFYDRPLYERCKEDLSSAFVSEKLFRSALSRTQQYQMAQEEIMVIALERFIIPRLTTFPLIAYRKAYEKLTTSMTDGWFNDFLIDNFPVLKKPPLHPSGKNFVELFNEALASDVVKPLRS